MIRDRSFSACKFLIIFVAIVLIILMMIGLAISLGQSNLPAQAVQVTEDNAGKLLVVATQTFESLPNAASAPPVLLPTDTPTATVTPASRQWEVLPPLPDNERGLITNGDRSEYKVALTFDVCQTEGDLAGYDAGIVKVLNETQTPATFFLGGLWMRDHQTETLELANNPLFELGNHSWSHRDLSAAAPEETKSEILLAQQMMYNILGYQTNLFRLPYGTYSEDTLNILGENGLYVIQWNIESGDPDPDIDAQRMTDWVLQQVQPGSIIIMHANGRGWHTAEALPAIIQSIRQQGYTPVTISDLLKIQPYK